MFASAVPGFGEFRFSKDRSVALVMAYSDIDPGTYYLFDAAKKQLEVVAKKRAWVKPELMAERKPILYKARDGLMIPALSDAAAWRAGQEPAADREHPRRAAGTRVLLVGVGPLARGPVLRFSRLCGPGTGASSVHGVRAQALLHRLQAMGQAAQDDMTDGALHLVKEGIVAKDRMCQHGGSYGGYASLQGLVREPDLFKCAHSFVAVTDLGLMQSVAWSDIAEDVKFDFLNNEFKVLTGDSKDDAEMFQRVSPARNADKIKGAVMLTMGSDDVRVPLIHGEKMRDAMIKAGKPIEWKVYAEEGHGFNKEANVTDFYTRSLRFYDEHIGPKRKAQP